MPHAARQPAMSLVPETAGVPETAEEKVMKPYLRKLMREHRTLNRLIRTTKALGAQNELREMKRLRLRIKDKIAAMQRHYYGRALSV